MQPDKINQAEQFMSMAIEQAAKALGRTAPNPPVGAVLVLNGKVVGRGYHPAAGQPHAEVFALQNAGTLSRGADLYVTLEPCCHQGRTGPCTEAVIKAGVSRVFVGVQDPNSQVAGRGLEILRSAGIEVYCDVLAEECRQLIAPFAKYITTGLPYVVFKSAMTLDGQTATATGDSKWISSASSRSIVHQLRNQVDGIIVGSGTVLSDDPLLTTRLDQESRDPVRVVFDGSLKTSFNAQVYGRKSPAKALLVTASGHPESALQGYRDAGVEIIEVAAHGGGLDLVAAMVELGKRDLHYLLLEGGSRLAGSMVRAGLVDRVMIFIAPKLLGGEGRSLLSGEGAHAIVDASLLTNMRMRQVDTDILIEGEVHNVHRSD